MTMETSDDKSYHQVELKQWHLSKSNTFVSE